MHLWISVANADPAKLVDIVKRKLCAQTKRRECTSRKRRSVSMYLHPLSKKRKRLPVLPVLRQNMKKMFHSRASRGGRNIYGLSFYSVS
jgi:hypothetical protein